jgi:hypothetical protein
MHGSGGKPKWKLPVKVQLHNISVQIKLNLKKVGKGMTMNTL